MIDLNGIAAFVAVVEAGSFTGGARALQMPKGSIMGRQRPLPPVSLEIAARSNRREYRS